MRRNEPRDVLIQRSKRMPNGCLEWQGTKDKDGYGEVRINYRKHRAHRLAFETFRGPIPAGLVLDHVVCDNPSCVDWWHTEPRTDRENVLRSSAPPALNARKTRCPRGHKLVGSNLCASPSGAGHRRCRICRNERQRVRRREASHA